MEAKEFSGSIKRKLIIIILLISTLTATIWYIGFIYWFTNTQQERTISLSETVAHTLSQNFAKLILLNDVSNAADISSQLSSFKRIQSMVLYKKDGTPIYQYSKDDISFAVKPLAKYDMQTTLVDDVMTIYVDAMYLSNHLGYVKLRVEVKSVLDLLKQHSRMIVLGFVLMILISYLLALFYARGFTQPILKLVHFLEEVESLAFIKNRIKTEENNEFGKLYCEVNTMLERMESSYNAQKLASVAFETQSGMTITDADQKILQVNKAFTKITGYEPSEVLGHTPSILKSGLQSETFYKNMMLTLHKSKYWSGEIYNRAKNGTLFPQHLTIQVVDDDEGNIIYYVASFIDLTLQKSTEAKLQYLREYDMLTGLVNRELFLSELQGFMDQDKGVTWGALLSMDIKDFKLINDAYGHDSGDRVLVEVAKRLKANFTNALLIGRVSGDQYILWFDDLDAQKERASIQSQELAQELVVLLQEVFVIDNKQINIGVHVGIALCNKETKESMALLKQADSALHLAQKQDKQIGFFDEQAEKMAMAHIDLYSQLVMAIDNCEFELYYQLQYDKDQKPYAAESLIRWHHPTRGVVSPLEFISTLEKSGLIVKLGQWIITEVCQQLSLWKEDKSTASLSIAINVSAKQFREERFVSE